MKRLCALLLMVMTTTTLLTVVDGSCNTIPTHYTLMGSKKVIACEHDHMEYLVGSIIRTTDCDECKCTETGMHCCGIGHKAGAIHVPEGHKIERYQCDFEIVKIGGREIFYDK
ncbi:hypothetical protein ACJMK2_040124 [Sinanodonta woodiana]|uniref:Beta-microseminoprotein n=1 Tax=Sinanodonta woodiana TaxID=1069815 RepID=A0ABD3WDK9_SINWO